MKVKIEFKKGYQEQIRLSKWQIEEFNRWAEVNPMLHCLVCVQLEDFDIDAYTHPFPFER
jgi:hypothetical protein